MNGRVLKHIARLLVCIFLYTTIVSSAEPEMTSTINAFHDPQMISEKISDAHDDERSGAKNLNYRSGKAAFLAATVLQILSASLFAQNADGWKNGPIQDYRSLKILSASDSIKYRGVLDEQALDQKLLALIDKHYDEMIKRQRTSRYQQTAYAQLFDGPGNSFIYSGNKVVNNFYVTAWTDSVRIHIQSVNNMPTRLRFVVDGSASMDPAKRNVYISAIRRLKGRMKGVASSFISFAEGARVEEFASFDDLTEIYESDRWKSDKSYIWTNTLTMVWDAAARGGRDEILCIGPTDFRSDTTSDARAIAERNITAMQNTIIALIERNGSPIKQVFLIADSDESATRAREFVNRFSGSVQPVVIVAKTNEQIESLFESLCKQVTGNVAIPTGEEGNGVYVKYGDETIIAKRNEPIRLINEDIMMCDPIVYRQSLDGKGFYLPEKFHASATNEEIQLSAVTSAVLRYEDYRDTLSLQQQGPEKIGFVLDCSNSMRYSGELERSVRIISEAIEDPQVDVDFIMLFAGDKIQELVLDQKLGRYTVEQFQSAVDRFNGTTPGFEAIYWTVDKMQQLTDGGKVIFITDGEPTDMGKPGQSDFLQEVRIALKQKLVNFRSKRHITFICPDYFLQIPKTSARECLDAPLLSAQGSESKACRDIALAMGADIVGAKQGKISEMLKQKLAQDVVLTVKSKTPKDLIVSYIDEAGNEKTARIPLVKTKEETSKGPYENRVFSEAMVLPSA
ncbi:MAG: hypothetical protein JW938_01860 [Candidatus Omnitrophica bacterium]|nr:hypothetical protein [Candidatus Omnitrophota bacterium]